MVNNGLTSGSGNSASSRMWQLYQERVDILRFLSNTPFTNDLSNKKSCTDGLPLAACGIPTSVLSFNDTLKYVNSEQGQKEHIFVLAKLPKDVRLLERGLQTKEMNVGNQAPTPGTQFKMVTHLIAVTADNASIYRAVAAKGYKLISKMMSSDRATDFLETLQKDKL